jgi:hypothetical protein
MVLRAIPVIRDTAAIPPQPAANASLVAKTRRCRSSRYGPSVSNRRRIAASLITTLHTAQTRAAQLPHVEYSDSIIVLRPLSRPNLLACRIGGGEQIADLSEEAGEFLILDVESIEVANNGLTGNLVVLVT